MVYRASDLEYASLVRRRPMGTVGRRVGLGRYLQRKGMEVVGQEEHHRSVVRQFGHGHRIQPLAQKELVVGTNSRNDLDQAPVEHCILQGIHRLEQVLGCKDHHLDRCWPM